MSGVQNISRNLVSHQLVPNVSSNRVSVLQNNASSRFWHRIKMAIEALQDFFIQVFCCRKKGELPRQPVENPQVVYPGPIFFVLREDIVDFLDAATTRADQTTAAYAPVIENVQRIVRNFQEYCDHIERNAIPHADAVARAGQFIREPGQNPALEGATMVRVNADVQGVTDILREDEAAADADPGVTADLRRRIDIFNGKAIAAYYQSSQYFRLLAKCFQLSAGINSRVAQGTNMQGEANARMVSCDESIQEIDELIRIEELVRPDRNLAAIQAIHERVRLNEAQTMFENVHLAMIANRILNPDVPEPVFQPLA